MEVAAPTLVPALARKMVRDGLCVESLGTIAAGLFSTRVGFEADNRPKNAVEVNNYATVMHFVARISPRDGSMLC